MLYWRFNTVDDNGNIIKEFPYSWDNNEILNGTEVLSCIIKENIISIWTGSVVYRKDFLIQEGIRYTEGCVAGEDSEFIYKCLCRAKEVCYINKVLSFYVQRKGSIMNSYNIKRFDSVAAMQRVYNYFELQQNKNLKEMAVIIRNNLVGTNYTGTYRLLMDQLVKEKNINAIQPVFPDSRN